MDLLEGGYWTSKNEDEWAEVKSIDEACTQFCDNIKALFEGAKEVAKRAR